MATERYPIQMNLRVTEELKRMVQRAADLSGVSVQRFCRYLLFRGIGDFHSTFSKDANAARLWVRSIDETLLMEPVDIGDPNGYEKEMAALEERVRALQAGDE